MTPTLVLLQCQELLVPRTVGWTVPLLTETLGPAGLGAGGGGGAAPQEGVFKALAKLFLIGSEVSVATFFAISQSSLFCAVVASKFLRP